MRDLDPAEVIDESIIDLPRGWRARDLFDQLLEGRGVSRRVRLEVSEWLGVLTMVQRGMGIAYGPAASVDHDIFRDVEVATLIGAPLWELGVLSRDEALRGAAGRAFLAAYRQQCAERAARRDGSTPH
jgi:DNA-binding transcriptional LysR family regulator